MESRRGVRGRSCGSFRTLGVTRLCFPRWLPKVRPLQVYHGKIGRGLSVEMRVKTGPVTLLSVAESKEHEFKLLFAEAQTVRGPILEIGNTNSRYRFSTGARNFVNRWNEQAPAHHRAVGVGHIGGKLERLAVLLGIEAVRIC